MLYYDATGDAGRPQNCPMLFVVAAKDELVDNNENGIKAYNLATGPKKLVTIPNITHYDIYSEGRLEAAKLESHGSISI